MFVKPMLASPIPDAFVFERDWWVAEEKYDGHRLCVTVEDGRLEALTRDRNVRLLPPHVRTDLLRLPNGIFDCELVSTHKAKAYGVTDLAQVDHLQVVIFDVTRLLKNDTTKLAYVDRRALLEEIFRTVSFTNGVTLSKMYYITSLTDARALAQSVWNRGGEGLVLKRTDSRYETGKRTKTWLKIKQSHTAVLKVVGFQAGLLGPHAVTVLEDADGNQTTVKTLNTRERERIGQNPASFLGVRLRIEFQERTPDGGYRHPMWDRWETE